MKQNIFQKNLPYFLISIPIVFYWFIFNKYALNLPHWDDYAVKTSIEKINSSESFIEKLNLLFSQHNEHRIFLTRIVSLAIFKIKGTLDFKWLMFIASLALLGILFLFYKITKKYNLSSLAFVPLPFIFLTISLYENTFWGMASLQNFWVIFLAFLSFYLLTQGNREINNLSFILANIACFWGIFTSSNGILIPIIGVLILLFQQKKQQLFAWIGINVLSLGSYFITYQKPLDIASKTANIPLQEYAKGLFVTLGAGIEAYQNTIDKIDFSMALGLFLFVFIVLFFYNTVFNKYNLEKKNSDLFLLACLAFIGITCLGIAFGRIGYGLGTLLSSKYKIYSILLLMIFYLVAANSMANRGQTSFIKLSIIGSILFSLYTFFLDYENIRYQHQERLTDEMNLNPKRVFSTFLNSQNVQNQLTINQTPQNIHIDCKFSENLSFAEAQNGFYVVLKSDSNSYIFPSKLYWKSKKDFVSRNFIFNQSIPLIGFHANISKLGIKTGKYQINILKIENSKESLYPTQQTIDIQEVKLDNSKQNW